MNLPLTFTICLKTNPKSKFRVPNTFNYYNSTPVVTICSVIYDFFRFCFIHFRRMQRSNYAMTESECDMRIYQHKMDATGTSKEKHGI